MNGNQVSSPVAGSLGRWRLMNEEDATEVVAVAAEVHPNLPETRDVLVDKWARGQGSCFVYAKGGRVCGYALAHPWIIGNVPKLDAVLGELNGPADCLFLHDIALESDVRGKGASAEVMERLKERAGQLDLKAAAMVSVYGTARLWQRHGFQPHPATVDVQGYGAQAIYLVNPSFALA